MAKTLRVDTLPPYELIHRKPVPTQAEPDHDLAKRTSRLPPKPLPGRPRYRPFVIATLITVLNLVALAVLISKIKPLLPATDWDDYGINLTETSCDLVNRGNSTRWQSALQINLRGAAPLTFAQAKFVDLVFDLIVGQGGRLLLAAISYIVFMDALLRSMEIEPVSYKLYASLVFSSTSLVATWYATKAVFSTKGWRGKLYLTWCALAMLYVLAFPTLIESVTGYVSPSSPGFNLAIGQFITADSDDLKSCFSVTAGLLLGFDRNNTRAVGPPAHVFDAVSRYYRQSDQPPSGVNVSSPFWSMVTYHSEPYEWGYKETPEPLDDTGLTMPYNTDDKTMYYKYNITINGHMRFFNDSDPYQFWHAAYCYGDRMFYTDDMKPSTHCFNKPYFVWGFSSIVLYVILGLQMAWTLGMYCLWLDANLASKLVRAGRTIRGPFRAAADLAEALNETLGSEYCAYTDKEIEKELERSGNMVRYNSTVGDDDEQLLHVGLTAQPWARVLLDKVRLYGAEEKSRKSNH
ncbi:MAG: hypothetical protein Q9171_004397 [Xanthocarpia ochracea]